MARTSKIPRYEAFNKAANAFGARAQDPARWSDYLDSSKPLTLELGCGKAELSRGLAARYPSKNYIGIDLKADRLWRASKDSLEAKQANVAFMQANILDIEEYFKPQSASEIWITFPDPFPKARQAKHRMLNRNFLDIYKSILSEDGVVHFKTDNLALFAWALDLLSLQDDVMLETLTFDLHSSEEDDDTKIETYYESMFRAEGTMINYLRFQFQYPA